MAVAISSVGDVWDDTKRIHAIGVLAFSGNYASGGDALDFLTAISGAGKNLGTTKQPKWAHVFGVAGFVFEYDFTNKKVKVRVVGAITPAGTVAAPVFTGSALAAHRHNLHLNNADVADGATTRVNAGTNLLGANTGADILVAGVADTAGAGGIVDASAGTPAGTNSAPAFTGTPSTASVMAELAAGAVPPALSGDTVRFYTIFPKFS